jgi:hypothetical protein
MSRGKRRSPLTNKTERTANADVIGKIVAKQAPTVKPLYYVSVVEDDPGSGDLGVFIAIGQIDLWENEGYISDELSDTDGDRIEQMFAKAGIEVEFADESSLDAPYNKLKEVWQAVKNIPEIEYNKSFDKKMHEGAMVDWVHPYK